MGVVNQVVASAARTVTGQSSAIGPTSDPRVSLFVNVSASSGTIPTLDLTIEWSQDAGTTWAVAQPADSYTQITTTGTVVKQFTVKAPHYRVKWTITGTTPSFTFAVSEYSTAN